MVFAYGLYDRLGAVVAAQPAPEYPLAEELTTEAGIVLGAIMLVVVLLVLHDRRQVLGLPMPPS